LLRKALDELERSADDPKFCAVLDEIGHSGDAPKLRAVIERTNDEAAEILDAISDATLPPECGRMLGLAVLAAMQDLGAEAILAGDDAAWRPARFALVSPTLVIVERQADRARS
jgi:hypothetical protein